MAARRRTGPVPKVNRVDVDVVLDACRLLVAISVRSLAAVSEQVDIVRLRILVVIGSHDIVRVSDIASATGISISKASRTCDRMAIDGLIVRTDDPHDRRNLRLSLTPAGRRILAKVAQTRRDAIRPALSAMQPTDRAELITVLREFTAAGGEPALHELWAMGWAT